MLLAVVWSRLPTKCLAKFLFHTSPTLEAFTGWLEALTSFPAAANPPDSSAQIQNHNHTSNFHKAEGKTGIIDSSFLEALRTLFEEKLLPI